MLRGESDALFSMLAGDSCSTGRKTFCHAGRWRYHVQAARCDSSRVAFFYSLHYTRRLASPAAAASPTSALVVAAVGLAGALALETCGRADTSHLSFCKYVDWNVSSVEDPLAKVSPPPVAVPQRLRRRRRRLTMHSRVLPVPDNHTLQDMTAKQTYDIVLNSFAVGKGVVLTSKCVAAFR